MVDRVRDLPLLDRRPRAPLVADVPGLGSDQPVVLELLEAVGYPAAGPGGGDRAVVRPRAEI